MRWIALLAIWGIDLPGQEQDRTQDRGLLTSRLRMNE